MIMLWLGCWLYNFLGGTHDAWWGFPFVMTFLLLVVFEVIAYGAIIVEINERSKNQST